MYNSLKSKIKSRQFAVIRRRYSLPEVLLRGIHNAIALAMSICVAFSNKVMDTRRPQPIGCGGKYDVYGFGLKYLLCAFCNAAKYPSPADKSATSPAGGEVSCVFFTSTSNVIRRWYSLPEVLLRGIHNAIPLAMSICVAYGNKVVDTRLPQPAGCGGKYDIQNGVQCGRSMIEMLGVLAIIGVLSVGGIAGYSKAMQKYKINAAIENHRNIIMSLLQQTPNISRANTNVNLNNIVYALELIPQSWEVHFAGNNNAYLDDELGNGVVSSYYSDRDAMLYSIALNSENETSVNDINYQFCLNYITNIIQPLSDVVIQFSLYRYTVSNDVYYGKNNCSPNRNCLSQITLSDITNKCKICNTKIGNNTCKLNLLLRF